MPNSKQIEDFATKYMNNIINTALDRSIVFPHCLTFADNDKDLCNKITFVNFDDKDEYNSRQCVNDLITNYIRNGRPINLNIQDLKDGKIESPFVFPKRYQQSELSKSRKIKLKKQQKFMGKLINPQTNIRGMLIYHGLGSGKTGTSIVVGEAFKKYYADKNDKTDLSKTPGSGRSSGKIVVVVPAQTKPQYEKSIKGFIYSLITQEEKLKKLEENKKEIEKLMRDHKETLENMEEKDWETLNKNLEKCLENKEKQEDISSFTKEIKIDGKEQNYYTKKNLKLEEQKEKSQVIQASKALFNQQIFKNYRILSREKFTKDLFDYNEDLMRTYNPTDNDYLKSLQQPNGLLIIDEVQNLVSEKGSRYNNLLTAIKYYFHPTTRIILLSATPINNTSHELGLTLNLLKPRVYFPDTKKKFDEMFIGKQYEKRIIDKIRKKINKKSTLTSVEEEIWNKHNRTKKYFDEEKKRLQNDKEKIKELELRMEKISTDVIVNKDILEYMCSGYISYFKGGNPKGFPKKITEYVYTPMNNNQIDLYQNILEYELKKHVKERKNTTYNIKSREVSNVILHGGNFESYKPDNTKTTRENIFDTKISLMRTTLNNLRNDEKKIDFIKENYSSKFAKIIQNIIKEEHGPGTHFVYSSFLNSGVRTLGVMLETMGWNDLTENIDKKIKNSNGKNFVIWSGDIGKRKSKAQEIKNLKEKKNNFRKGTMEKFNSDDNIEGEQLKIIFGTNAIMEGIDFKHVKYVHIVEPWWNDSRIEQVEARAIRWKSHTNLKQTDEQFVKVYKYYSTGGFNISTILNNNDGKTKSEIINRYIDSQGQHPDAEEFLLQDVDHVLNDPERINYSLFKTPIDLIVKKSAGNKKILNNKFYKIMKESSIDCLFNKWGNILRFEKEIYTNKDLFNSKIFNIKKEDNLILYYDPSEDKYYHKNEGNSFTEYIKTYKTSSKQNLFEFVVSKKEKKFKYEKVKVGSTFFYDIVKKEELECNISTVTGKKLTNSNSFTKLKEKSNPEVLEKLQPLIIQIKNKKDAKELYSKIVKCITNKKLKNGEPPEGFFERDITEIQGEKKQDLVQKIIELIKNQLGSEDINECLQRYGINDESDLEHRLFSRKIKELKEIENKLGDYTYGDDTLILHQVLEIISEINVKKKKRPKLITFLKRIKNKKKYFIQ